MDIRTSFSQEIPLLFDGGMGTLFAARQGGAADRCETANLDQPDWITEIHRAYLEAGCRAIKTNTFSAGVDLAQGRAQLAHRILETGSRLALDAAAPYRAFVFADLGPVPQDSGHTPGELYLQQAEIFLRQGITHFLVETLPSDEGIAALAQGLKERCPQAFLIVSFAVGPDGVTREGRQGLELFRHTAALPQVDAVGFNCISGPHHLLEYIKGLPLGNTHLSVMPNAGYPTVLGRRTVYQGKPDYFAQKMAQIVQAGASIVGGCCGTTPEHIARLAAVLAHPLPKVSQPTAHAHTPARKTPGYNPLWDKLSAGKRVIAVELDPPADDGIAGFLSGVQALHQAGADAITISDCPIGHPRADSSLLACKIKRELGIEPLPHMTCRDRNLNAIKALLLGLAMEEVHNILLVTGDPIPTEDRDEVKCVFHFNSRKLARYVSSLGEHSLSTPFHIFGALNLNARNFDIQLKLALEKESCGMTGFLTQPVLSQTALDNLKLARATLKGKLLGGIFPVVSHRNACFLNNEISGIHVCDEIVSLYEGKSREEAESLAVQISTQVAQAVEPYTDGLYLMTPFQRVSLMTRIMEKLCSI